MRSTPRTARHRRLLWKRPRRADGYCEYAVLWYAAVDDACIDVPLSRSAGYYGTLQRTTATITLAPRTLASRLDAERTRDEIVSQRARGPTNHRPGRSRDPVRACAIRIASVALRGRAQFVITAANQIARRRGRVKSNRSLNTGARSAHPADSLPLTDRTGPRQSVSTPRDRA